MASRDNAIFCALGLQLKGSSSSSKEYWNKKDVHFRQKVVTMLIRNHVSRIWLKNCGCGQVFPFLLFLVNQ